MKINGTITYSEADIRALIIADVERRLSVKVSDDSVWIGLCAPVCAGAVSYVEANINVHGGIECG